eukprot:EG_transcript_28927
MVWWALSHRCPAARLSICRAACNFFWYSTTRRGRLGGPPSSPGGPKLEELHTALAAHIKARDVNAIRLAYSQLQAQRLQPTPRTFELLRQGFTECREHKALYRLPSEMQQAGLKPDIKFYNSLLKAFGKHGNVPLLELTKEDMDDAGVKPNAETFNALIEAYMLAGDAASTQRVKTDMALMKEKGLFGFDVYGEVGEAWEAGIPQRR